MRSTSRRSPSLILATGALVLSLGGTAFALPGKNSVDKNDIRTAAVNSSDIRNGSVQTPDLAFGGVTTDKLRDGAVNSLKLLDNSVSSADIEDDAVESRDVKNDSLTGQDIQDASLTGADVQDNSLTGQDINESTLQGVMPAQTRFVTDQTGELSGAGGGTPATISVTCPAGERAIGGGGAWLIPTLNGGNDPTALDRAFLSASMPTPAQPGTDAATGWQVAGRNVTGTNRILRVYAICVPNQIP
jgi:hypothetical protein